MGRGNLYEMLKEDNAFSHLQLMDLDGIHQLGYVPTNLGEYKCGDTVPHWVAPTETE